MLFTIKWLSNLFPEYKGPISDAPIDNVITDSRLETENALFIPIIGERFDGHQFVYQALEHGAKAVFWDKKKELPEHFPDHISLFFVDDTTEALQLLAMKYREEINPKVIGVTGSNGKTTTKDLVASVVKSSYKCHYTKGNLNNHIGLPLTILSMPRDTDVLVVEMGMNHFGEIEALSRIAKPDYGIITNIGESHIEFLGSREGIAKAKLEITAGMKKDGLLIVDGDEPLLLHEQTGLEKMTCGYGKECDYQIREVQLSIHGTRFTVSRGGEFSIPLAGRHHAKNALFAIAVAEKLGISSTEIKDSLASMENTGMRFEMLKGKNGVSIINDAYNASPTSMKGAIETVKQLAGYEERVLVLGDILELGSHAEEMHASIADVIEKPITAVLTYGEKAKLISESVKKNRRDILCKHFDTKEALLHELPAYFHENAVILFKASRKLQFETFIESII